MSSNQISADKEFEEKMKKINEKNPNLPYEKGSPKEMNYLSEIASLVSSLCEKYNVKKVKGWTALELLLMIPGIGVEV